VEQRNGEKTGIVNHGQINQAQPSSLSNSGSFQMGIID